ncbi:MAG: hypothetical protein DRJ42_26140 [Deltaproteobacteria bacterium]|nr:MAG: hypothetical protein DRJ42_26140 [Deltaproteobacteria bacterium]
MDLRPASALGASSAADLLSRWDACVADAPGACGYLVFSVSADRHGSGVSIAMQADTLDGAASLCLGREARRLQRTPEQNPVWTYRAAVVVAPSPAELDACASGIEAALNSINLRVVD